MKENCAQSQQG